MTANDTPSTRSIIQQGGIYYFTTLYQLHYAWSNEIGREGVLNMKNE